MPGEKTEQPTDKRLREARKKGQVFKSQDLTQSFLFMTAAAVLVFGGGVFVHQLQDLMRESFRPETFRVELTEDAILSRLGYAFGRFLLLALPMVGGLAMVAAAVNFFQVKALFSMEIIKPKFEKLNPVTGFQNLFFKSKTYIDLLKNIIKFTIVLLLAYYIIRGSMREVILSARLDVSHAGALAGELMAGLLLRVGIVFLIIGAADFFIQKRLYMKDQMMSKEDIKQEYKQDEGDPHIKSMRRHLHEELLSQNIVASVPKASVVVVNPTHLAIALRYDEGETNAPVVTAKGQMLRAEKIIEIAKQNRVPVLRNVPLAHSLYAVEIDQEIPEELFEAVAEVLNWVYSLAAER